MADMKERWELCERVGKILGLSKSVVYNGFRELEPYISRILEGDQEAIALVPTLQWYGHGDKKPKKAKKDTEVIDDDDGQLRTAMWFIRKMGSVERARKVLDAAATAMDMLKD